jgi:hypothetical protein
MRKQKSIIIKTNLQIFTQQKKKKPLHPTLLLFDFVSLKHVLYHQLFHSPKLFHPIYIFPKDQQTFARNTHEQYIDDFLPIHSL